MCLLIQTPGWAFVSAHLVQILKHSAKLEFEKLGSVFEKIDHEFML